MSKKTKAGITSKVETVQEFLARGGSISKVPMAAKECEEEVIRKTSNGAPAVLLTLEEADLYYGEKKKTSKVKKQKPALKIDLEALPPALRAKFIAKLKEEADGQGYEEELEEIENNLEEEDEDDKH